VLIAGGFTTSTDLYDPDSNTFEPSSPVMHDDHSGGIVALLANGKVLIAGGLNGGDSPIGSMDLYDSTTNTFAASPPSMNSARYEATATLLPNGKVLIAGGFNGSVATNSTDLYTP
jgi:galactose oxidase-like protein